MLEFHHDRMQLLMKEYRSRPTATVRLLLLLKKGKRTVDPFVSLVFQGI